MWLLCKKKVVRMGWKCHDLWVICVNFNILSSNKHCVNQIYVNHDPFLHYMSNSMSYSIEKSFQKYLSLVRKKCWTLL